MPELDQGSRCRDAEMLNPKTSRAVPDGKDVRLRTSLANPPQRMRIRGPRSSLLAIAGVSGP